MYRVLVVDDDILSRSNIRRIFNANESRFELTEEAGDGRTALKKLENVSVDIVLTDMRMPVMDGVELSRQIHARYPEMIIVAISNYNDFEYVQSAMRVGVRDYILKHTITRETLLKTLDSLVGSTKTRSEKINLNYDSMEALKNRFIMNMLTGFCTSSDYVKENIRFLKLPIAEYNLLPVMMRISRQQEIRQEKDYYLTSFSVMNICSEVFNDSCHGVIIPVHDYTYCIVLHFPEIYSKSSLEHTIFMILERIKNALLRFMNLNVYLAEGKLCSTLQELPESYDFAQKQLQEKTKGFAESVFLTEKSELMNEAFWNEDLTELLEQYLLNLQKKQALHCIDQIFFEIEKKYRSRASLQIVLGEVLHSLKKMCKKNAININRNLQERLADLIQEGGSESTGEVRECFKDIVEDIFLNLENGNQVKISEYTRQVLKIVHNSSEKEISLGSVAEYIGVSNSYLSTIFKNDTGYSFSEYVVKVRLDKAKALLETGDESIRKIAEKCGFNSYEYFFAVFKKSTGMTPRQYIVQQKCRKI